MGSKPFISGIMRTLRRPSITLESSYSTHCEIPKENTPSAQSVVPGMPSAQGNATHSATLDASQPLSPIYNLPPEILSLIHTFVCEGAPDERRTKTALQLSRVCPLWRDVAYNNPHLWTHISFGNARLALFCLRKSKDLGVSITLQHQQILDPLISLRYILDPSEYDKFKEAFDRNDHLDLAEALRVHAFHIEQIDLSIMDALHPSLTSYALSVLESLNASRIRALRVHMQQFPISVNTGVFKGKFPSLRTLSLSFYLPLSTSPLWDALPNLEDFTLVVPVPSPSITEYLSVLKNLPNLRRFVIMTPVERYNLPTLPASQSIVQLPNLTHCHITLELPIAINLLSCLRMPNLTLFQLRVAPTALTSHLEPLVPVLWGHSLLDHIHIIKLKMREPSNITEPIQEFSLEGYTKITDPAIFRLECIQLTSITGILSLFHEARDVFIQGGRFPNNRDLGRLPKATTLYLQRSDIRILSEFYLYETMHNLQTLYLHDMFLNGRTDLIRNFRHLKKVGFSHCPGVDEEVLKTFRMRAIEVNLD